MSLEPDQVVLHPRQWTSLPGTEWQVYRCGRLLLNRHSYEQVVIRRGNDRWRRFGGWDLSPVWGQCYVRRRPDQSEERHER